MKRIIFFVLVILIALPVISFAESNNNNIEITFKIGDEEININGKMVKDEKPIVVNGTTLVPLRVIAEAFGAEVIWNGEEECVILNFEGTEIKVFIGYKEATVNGATFSMLEAPIILNSSTMVPLRFISENFGAQVNYEESTELITVNKDINSEKVDFYDLLDITAKDKIGDSYYNWSMDYPEDLSLYYRSFDGKENTFSNEQETVWLYLYVFDLEDNTIDSIYNERISSLNKDVSITNYEKGKNFYIIKYKDEFYDGPYTCEERVYINNKIIFCLQIDIKDDSSNDRYKVLLNSFSSSFPADKTSIKDLSEVDDSGLRKYTNNQLSYSISLFPEWYQLDNEDYIVFSENEFIDTLNYDLLSIGVFSVEEDFTLDKLELEEVEQSEKFNEKVYKINSIEDCVLNNKECKKIIYEINSNNKTSFSYDYNFVENNYRYILCYNITDDHLNDLEYFKKVDNILKSFTINSINKDKVGIIIDKYRMFRNESNFRKIKLDEYNFECSIPDNWVQKNGSYTSYNNTKSFTLNTAQNVGIDVLINDFEESYIKPLKEIGIVSNYTKTQSSSFGTRVNKYNIKRNVNDLIIIDEYRIFEKNNIIYSVIFSYLEIYDSEDTKNIFNKIWNSVEIGK